MSVMLLVGLVLLAVDFDFGLTPVATTQWGGMLVTLVVSVTGIVASMPSFQVMRRTVGWWSRLDAGQRATVQRMLGLAGEPKVPDFLIDAAYDAPAELAVIPLQDLLALPSESRMNSPGTTAGNWRWRFDWDQLDPALPAVAHARAARSARLSPTAG